MEYHDYLPEYPSINDEDFYERIVQKAEFWENTDSGSYFQPQINIARYMSQWTLYDSIFLFHEMGTGKSGLTIALTEQVRDRSRILYITHNQTQIDNYKMEIYKFSRRLATGVEHGTDISSHDRFRRKWNSVLYKDGYEFMTIGTIVNEFSKRNPLWLKEKYEKSIIILDEAHHLVQTNKEEEKKAYTVLLEFLDLLDTRKLVVMSGTPIRDQPDEIIPLLNLVLPPQRRLKRNDFIQDFFEVERQVAVLDRVKLPLYRWRGDMCRVFHGLLKGRISYLRRERTNVRVEYIGMINQPMQSMRLHLDYMKPDGVQNQVYMDVFQDECMGEEDGGDDEDDTGLLGGVATPKKKASFYSKSKQASLCVFPDGSIGEKGFSRYVNPNLTLNRSFTNTFGPDIALVPKDSLLSTLASYSSIYTGVLKEILNHPNQLVYIFSDLVEGSGILLFLAILKTLFHFKVVATPQDLEYTRGDRVICLNDRVCDEDHFQQLISYFNDPGNAHGEFCQVILSTNKTKEGISLKNVQQIHIMTPSWNMGDTSQAIARSLRARSHVDLDNPSVRIFLHAAIPSIPPEDLQGQNPVMYSIDFQRYFRSEIKERNTKLVERAFLEAAWDCLMNKDIHIGGGRHTDGSLECEYSTCEYQCDGVSPDTQIATDKTNLNMFYNTVEYTTLLTRVQDFFTTTHIAARVEIIAFISPNNPIMGEKVLDSVVSIPLSIKTPRGQCFLCQSDDLFFLVDNPFLPYMGVYAFYYYQNPASSITFPLPDLIDGYYAQNIKILLPRLLRMIHTKHPSAKQFFLAFPLQIQSLFCEIAVQHELLHPDRVRVPLRQWFITEFPTDFTFIPDIHIDHRFVLNKKSPRRLLLNRPSDGWSTIPHT